MVANRPLPRSLDPLPDESLPGYMLRLAHRLSLTPARLAALTGLAAGSRFPSWIPASTLVHLPAAARDAFALATRLTPAEVEGLCLSSMSRRYPLPTAIRDNHRSNSMIRLERWVFAPATRYCPRCLAGDGSAVRRAHGGPGRKTWHLPVVFACTDHQRLLEHLCPACSRPAHGLRSGSPTVLLPQMRAAALHPAQCRAETTPGNGRRLPTCCAARLDAPAAGQEIRATHNILALQQRVLDLLRADGPETTVSAGQPTQPPRYFIDLRVLTLLVCSSWPAARPMAPSAGVAAAIDRHVDRQHQRIAAVREQSPTSRPLRILDAPPPDAAAGAGLIAIADQILSLASPTMSANTYGPCFRPAPGRPAVRSGAVWPTAPELTAPTGSEKPASPSCSPSREPAAAPRAPGSHPPPGTLRRRAHPGLPPQGLV